MQSPKVRKTLQKPTICPCGSTGNAPKSSGQSTFREKQSAIIHGKLSIGKLGQALIDYSRNHDGCLPAADEWCDRLKSDKLITDDHYFTIGEKECGFAFNEHISGSKLDKISTNCTLLFESDGPWNHAGGEELLKNKIVNIIYAVSFYLFPALTIYAVVVISKNSRMPGFWKITMSIILVLILLLMIRYHVYQIDKYRSLKVKDQIEAKENQ